MGPITHRLYHVLARLRHLGLRRRPAPSPAEISKEIYEHAVEHSGTSIQFPHCDTLILHSPGVCEYCDRKPEWQALRFEMGIAFSDDTAETVFEDGLFPCPSTARRPAEVRDLWYGNVPKPAAAR